MAKKNDRLIGDEGIESVKDPVGIIAIVFCNATIVLLVVLGILAII